ncbi:hypothetical protein [Bacillus sp. V33-4]|nr:hypothetical protein [Bacillus sp. V33-4]
MGWRKIRSLCHIKLQCSTLVPVLGIILIMIGTRLVLEGLVG